MKTYWGFNVQFKTFLNLALNGGEDQLHISGHFTPVGRTTANH
jgi:hypothetical protein